MERWVASIDLRSARLKRSLPQGAQGVRRGIGISKHSRDCDGLSGVPLAGLAAARGSQRLDRGFHLGGNRFRIANSQSSGLDRLAYTHLQWLALDVVGVHRQKIKGVDEGNGNYIRLRFYRKEKCTRQERLKVAVWCAASLWKNYQRHAFAEASERRFDCSD